MASLFKRYFYYYRKLGVEGIKIFRGINNKKRSTVKIKLAGAKFPFHLRQNTSDIQTFEHIFINHQYKFQLNFKPKHIFDLGANIGLASIYFANRFPTATIFAVEPDNSNFEMLLKNTEPYKNIHCLKYGVWYKEANLKIVDTGEGHWGFITKEVEEVNENTVEAKSIDGLMVESGITQIDLLKIDIEGAEKKIFECGFQKWLPKVKCMVIELHDRTHEGCSKAFFKALSSYDFSLRIRQENLICDLEQ